MEGFDLPMSFGKKPTQKKPSKTLANVAKTERTVRFSSLIETRSIILIVTLSGSTR